MTRLQLPALRHCNAMYLVSMIFIWSSSADGWKKNIFILAILQIKLHYQSLFNEKVTMEREERKRERKITNQRKFFSLCVLSSCPKDIDEARNKLFQEKGKLQVTFLHKHYFSKRIHTDWKFSVFIQSLKVKTNRKLDFFD